MMRCTECGREFDESIAMGICPHCGCFIEEKFPISDPGSSENASKDKQHFEDPRWLPVGTILHNRYRVSKVIGAGGFGITYLVWDTQNAVHKAVKEYFQQGVVNRIKGTTEVLISAPKRREEFMYGIERFLNEARIVAKFQSDSIVRVDDYFEENNTAYMVMEYLESQTLEEYILSPKKVLDPEQAINIGVRICEALEEIHAAGVIHRDIAPDNIFISNNGDVKIIDFGSARLSKTDVDDRLIVLKPGFAPPEQYETIDPNNDRHQAWTDVYALGATLYLCLTGQVPAEASDRKADFDKDQDRVCYPDKINPHIPEFLSNAIMTAMAINIHERFKSASELKEALLQERKVLPVEAVRKKKRIKRTVGISASIVLILLLAVTGIWRYFERKDDIVLNEAEVTIWYSVNSDANLAQQKTNVFEAMKAELSESDVFSEVTVELTAISEDEYRQRLEKANASGNMPLIFESVDPDAEYMRDVESLRDVLSRINKGSCYFIDDFNLYFSKDKRIPMGFNIPVIYINTMLVSDDMDGLSVSAMSDIVALCEGEMLYKPMVLNEELRDSYEKMFSDFADYAENLKEYSVEDFLNGEAVVYFSDTSDYYTVRNMLQSNFKMIPVSADKVVCQFCDYWSISSCEGDEEIAAKEVLAYFFANNIQDQYYVQTNLPGLPLEKHAVEDYAWVTRSMEEILTDLSKCSFGKQ